MLTKKQQNAVKMLVDSSLTQKKISEELGIHETTLSRWKEVPEFTEAVDQYTHKVMGRAAPEALRTMKALLGAKSELVRFNAAKDLLDRAGFAPSTEVDLQSTDIHLTIGGDTDGD
jgi:transposase-like protein